LNEKKPEEISLGNELRRVLDVPLDRLSIQLGVEPETAKLIHNLIRDFLRTQEEEAENSNCDPEIPIYFHKSGCQCKWCKLG